MNRNLFALTLAAAMSLSVARADVTLPAIFGDHMVLQRDLPLAVWGQAEAGEKVTVSLGDNTATATADKDGIWSMKLKPMKADGKAHVLTVKGKNTIELKNVLIGEVWLCSGQSNMAWTLDKAHNAAAAVPAAKHASIRLITVPRTPTEVPQGDIKGKWVECTPETAAPFSAVGYFFGKALHEKLDVPIGLINSSFGGTPAEAWTSRAALEAVADLKPLLENWDKQVVAMTAEKVQAANQAALKKWQDAAAKAKADGKEPPVKPRPIVEPRRSQNRPANLYNGMIHPLAPLSIRGAIWYQGESNVPRAVQYRTIFPTMIANWRKDFAQPEMPFGFVQLAPFRYTRNDPAWCAELWEAQLLTLKNVPNTGMAVITDLGDVKDIHPTNKQEVGRRLSLWARAKVYGEKDLAYSGPIYKAAKVEGNKMRITFDHADGLRSRDDKALTHFAIAGEDKVFHNADASVNGHDIVVTCDKVAKPVAVRFAWRDDAEPNLVNAAGLPASPFRTDDWPALTADRKH